MKFTVLGASGFIGSSFVRYAQSIGAECVTPGRNLDAIYSGNQGHIIYSIGLTADFRKRPHDTIRAHVCLLNEILEKAAFDSFLYLSSTRVYGVGSANERAEILVKPWDPDNLYNLSKLAGESICLANTNPSVRVARLANVYGEDFTSDNFLSSILRDMAAGEVIFRSAPETSKDYISVDDVVNLLMRIALSGKERMYNVASGVNVDHKTLASMIEALGGVRTRFMEGVQGRPLNPIAIARIRQEFSFHPKQLSDAFPVLIQRYKEFHDSNRH